MKLQRHSNGQSVTLDPTLMLGKGGEARVYAVPQDRTLVAKVYHQPTETHVHKLLAMLANPPHDPMVAQGAISFAWPVDLLRAAGTKPQIVGFLMPRVTGMRPIIDFYNPKTRRQQCPSFTYLYLHRTARNLAAAFGALHARGYVIGDVNESNILVTDTALVTLVDIDSVQVYNQHNNVVYRCPVGKPEFTPPELQGKPFADMIRAPEHDLFGLAVLIFQLLMEGTHPFAGIFEGSGDPPPYEVRIAAGHFPYSKRQRVPYHPMPLSPAFETLHPTLRQLFERCFEQGHSNPQTRPNAQTWQNALTEAEHSLMVCSANHYHYYGSHLPACPWCQRTLQLGGRDPFPSRQAIQQGQHLQPLPPKQKPLPSARSQPKPKPTVSSLRVPVTSVASPSVLPLPLKAIAQHSFSKTGMALSAAVVGTILLFGIAGLSGDWPFQPGRFTSAFNRNSPLDVSLANTLSGHASMVGSFVIKPDGQTLISSNGDGVIKLWNLLTGELLRTINAWGGCCVVSLTTSPDSQMLVTGSGDGTIKIWNQNTGDLLRTIDAWNGCCIASLAVSLDGQTLASGGGDGTIKIWNPRTGALIRTFAGRSGAIGAIAITPDKQTLISGNGDGTIRLWNLQTGKLQRTLAAHAGTVSTVTISSDGQILASGSTTDPQIKLWNLQTGTLLHTLTGNSGTVGALAISPDRRMLASGSWKGTINLWDLQTGALLHTLEDQSEKIWSVAFSPDSRILVSGSSDYSIEIYRLWRIEASDRQFRRYMIAGYDATARKDYKTALTHFQKALQESPNDPYAREAVGNVEDYIRRNYPQ